MKPRLLTLIVLIVGAVASRLAPHPWNLTSVAAVALFSGAYLEDRRLALVVPLAALLISDMALGFYKGMSVVYLSFALIVALGFWLRRHRSPLAVAGATLTGSLLFFGLTNLGVWAFGGLYPHTGAGLAACFTAALPFYRGTLEGDGLYSLILFGGFALLERKVVALRQPGPALALA
ncbi:MAG TPA: DUF6580 family putative transport protein [Caulobacteraceae bacterium]|nr:DUF6580 family putative transport protein [Caulobacteraceae bacterium]